MSENTKLLLMEVDRIEEDAEHSYKGHYNAASWWETINFIIGIPTAILSVIIGLVGYNEFPCISLALSILSASAVTMMMVLNPAKRAQQHKSAAGSYQNLRNRARIFKEIEIPSSTDFPFLKRNVFKWYNQTSDFSRQIGHFFYVTRKVGLGNPTEVNFEDRLKKVIVRHGYEYL